MPAHLAAGSMPPLLTFAKAIAFTKGLAEAEGDVELAMPDDPPAVGAECVDPAGVVPGVWPRCPTTTPIPPTTANTSSADTPETRTARRGDAPPLAPPLPGGVAAPPEPPRPSSWSGGSDGS